MDYMEFFKAMLYGLVEGITEWLPISSTGHMLLLDKFVTLHVSLGFWSVFLVVIQLAAVAAVCRQYFDVLNPLSPRKDDSGRAQTWALWGKIIVACLPAVAAGLLLDDWVESTLETPLVIAAALIFYGAAFIVIETIRQRRAGEGASRHAREGLRSEGGSARPRHAGRHLSTPQGSLASRADEEAPVQAISDIDYGRALGIGMFQVLALVPGTSRSGATIIGGLLLGCTRAVAAEFTFYLAIPVMVGASGLRIVRFFAAGGSIAFGELLVLIVASITAYVVSLYTVRLLMDFVRKHDFKPFGWYRIALGIAVLMTLVIAR